VTVTEVATSKDGKSTDSKKTTEQSNPDGSITVKTVSTSNDVQTKSVEPEENGADPNASNPI
jgi:hypothetical protein